MGKDNRCQQGDTGLELSVKDFEKTNKKELSQDSETFSKQMENTKFQRNRR